jgi:YidC/Oxa1 family membrane protein insertase
VQKKNEPAAPGINKDDSKVGMRAYARGRSYDPNRFGGVTPYRDPNGVAAAKKEKEPPKDDLFLPEEKTIENPAEQAVETTETASAPAVTQTPETEEVEVEVEEIEVEVDDDDKEGV